jgi:hypothetical protein
MRQEGRWHAGRRAAACTPRIIKRCLRSQGGSAVERVDRLAGKAKIRLGEDVPYTEYLPKVMRRQTGGTRRWGFAGCSEADGRVDQAALLQMVSMRAVGSVRSKA